MIDEIKCRKDEKHLKAKRIKESPRTVESPASVWMTSGDANINESVFKDFPYEHEIGFKLIFKKLPNVEFFSKRFPGKFGALIIIFVVIPWFLELFASIADGTLTLPGSATGLLEDNLHVPALLMIAVVLYLYRRAIEYIPKAYVSIVESNKIVEDNKQSEDIQAITSEELRKEAEYIMYYHRRSRRVIINISFIALAAIILAGGWYLDSNFTDPNDVFWSGADYFWGHLIFISYVTLVVCYFARVLLGYIFRLILSMKNFAKNLSERGVLRVQPLHPDHAGGLGQFGKLAWRIDIIIIPVIALLIGYFLFAERVDVNMFAIEILLTLALIPFLFFVPLRGLNAAMKKAKELEMTSLSKKFHKNYWLMRDWIDNKGISDYEGSRAEESIERIILLYDRAEKMPVWPFDRNTIGKVATTVIIPLVIVAIQLLVSTILSNGTSGN